MSQSFMKKRNVHLTDRRVVLVTGASSGIGRCVSVLLARRGWSVWAGARGVERMESLKEYGINILRLDVTDTTSIANCVEQILKTEGRIDALVNNAGFGLYGSVETIPMNEARRQFDVNVFGLAAMVKAVAPVMRRQGYGRIVNISSMAGKVHTAYGAWYHASKFAVEGFSDSLRVELKRFGIKVILVEPGLVRTRWNGIAGDALLKYSVDTPYEASAARVSKVMNRLYSLPYGLSPEKIARAVCHALERRYPRCRYLVGFMAKPSVFLRRLLPSTLYDLLLMKIEKV